MTITVFGAAGGEVTGSAYLLDTGSSMILVDFGMFQGSQSLEKLNKIPRSFPVKDLNAVLLTHGHLDHTGRLPMLTGAGYRGPVFATQATHRMAQLILRDAARLQGQDTERDNRRRKRMGLPQLPPPFTEHDVEAIEKQARDVRYDQDVAITGDVRARWVDAGHMLGSASIVVTISQGGSERVIVFSGDVGPRGAPFLRDPSPVHKADILFMESTYGDRDHKPLEPTIKEAIEIIGRAVKRGGKILVPTFAVGRAQNLMYLLAAAFREKKLPKFPVYLDSPMAIEATAIYARHPELYDEEAIEMANSGQFRAQFKNIILSPTAKDSRALNDVDGPCMILAGSGMCNGGRILHHLRHNLAHSDTVVLIVGYQSKGSLGRALVDGNKKVSIFGERIPVRASVHTLGGFSAHAGQGELLQWVEHLADSKPKIYLTHGEDRARQPFARLIKRKLGITPRLPGIEEEIEIR